MYGFASKRALAFFAFAGLFSLLIVFGNMIAPADETPHVAVPTTPAALTAPSPLPMPDAAFTPFTPDSAGTISTESPKNLTETIVSMIGKSIALRNPEGPSGGSINVEDAEKIAGDSLAAASLDTSALSRLEPAPEELLVTIDGTADEDAYHAASDAAFGMATDSFAPDAAAPLAERMAALSRAYGTIARELRRIPVPARLADLHRAAIRSALVKQRAFAAVAGYDTDPVYALLAIKTMKEMK